MENPTLKSTSPIDSFNLMQCDVRIAELERLDQELMNKLGELRDLKKALVYRRNKLRREAEEL